MISWFEGAQSSHNTHTLQHEELHQAYPFELLQQRDPLFLRNNVFKMQLMDWHFIGNREKVKKKKRYGL